MLNHLTMSNQYFSMANCSAEECIDVSAIREQGWLIGNLFEKLKYTLYTVV